MRIIYKSLDLFERDNVSFCSNKGIHVNNNHKNKTTIAVRWKFVMEKILIKTKKKKLIKTK